MAWLLVRGALVDLLFEDPVGPNVKRTLPVLLLLPLPGISTALAVAHVRSASAVAGPPTAATGLVATAVPGSAWELAVMMLPVIPALHLPHGIGWTDEICLTADIHTCKHAMTVYPVHLMITSILINHHQAAGIVNKSTFGAHCEQAGAT